jgi:formiminotetrahydrofolate cyclodeaminase
MLMDMTVKEFIEELASNSPAPGGGSVAALSGSLAAALMAHSGVMGAVFNVVINLGGIKDPAFRGRLQTDKDRIVDVADELREEIMEALDARLF